MRRLLADEQRHVVAFAGKEIGEFSSKPARGKIREAADIVHRFVSRPGCDDAVHVLIFDLARRCHKASQSAYDATLRPDNRNGSEQSSADSSGKLFLHWQGNAPAHYSELPVACGR